MPSDLNIVVTIGARDAVRDAYAVQLRHEGRHLADGWKGQNTSERKALFEQHSRCTASTSHDRRQKRL